MMSLLRRAFGRRSGRAALDASEFPTAWDGPLQGVVVISSPGLPDGYEPPSGALEPRIGQNASGQHCVSYPPEGAPMPTPSVGRIVHYVSYGTPIRDDGTQAYTAQCRAAVITEVGDPNFGQAQDTVGLCVLNPSGQFFHPLSDGGCEHDEGGKFAAWSCTGRNHPGGTWHWPARVDTAAVEKPDTPH